MPLILGHCDKTCEHPLMDCTIHNQSLPRNCRLFHDMSFTSTLIHASRGNSHALPAPPSPVQLKPLEEEEHNQDASYLDALPPSDADPSSSAKSNSALETGSQDQDTASHFRGTWHEILFILVVIMAQLFTVCFSLLGSPYFGFSQHQASTTRLTPASK
jgi:hypothetical protein